MHGFRVFVSQHREQHGTRKQSLDRRTSQREAQSRHRLNAPSNVSGYRNQTSQYAMITLQNSIHIECSIEQSL
jgi:hypothetical protein